MAKLADQIARGTGPKGQDKIARAVGRIENRYKLAKLFDISVAEDGFSFARNAVALIYNWWSLFVRLADEARARMRRAVATIEDDAYAKAMVTEVSSYLHVMLRERRDRRRARISRNRRAERDVPWLGAGTAGSSQ